MLAKNTASMNKKQYSFSGTTWEQQFNYARAVKAGSLIEVSGTTAVDEKDNVVGITAAEQATYIFEKIAKALQELGADLSDVTRTRMYITNRSYSQQVGEVHGKVFSGITPAATMLVVDGLIDPELLVEIEVTAYLAQ